MPNLFETPFGSEAEDLPGASSNVDGSSVRQALDIPLVVPTVGPRQERLLKQFQTAASNLFHGIRNHAADPLGGLRSAMDHICFGTTKPSIRLSKFDEFDNQRDVALACKNIAVEIVQAISLIHKCEEDASEAAAFDHASTHPTAVPAPDRTGGSCIGYMVDVSCLADAVQKLNALSEEGGPDEVRTIIPRAMRNIVTFCLLSFNFHLSPANRDMKLAVRYHPTFLEEFESPARWEIVGSVPATKP